MSAEISTRNFGIVTVRINSQTGGICFVVSPSVFLSVYLHISVNHSFLIYVLFFALLLELFTNLAAEVKQMKGSISYVQSLTSNKMVDSRSTVNVFA